MTPMPTWFRYDFGYSWPYTLGHLLVFGIAALIVALCLWRRWPRWTIALSAVLAVWSLGGAFIVHDVIQINEPVMPVTALFLPSGNGRVLDLGAGSGRATLGLLLSRPEASVVALDRYTGYYGIDDNTPERLRANARIAGVDGRLEVKVGDMRQLPFGPGEFDAAMSVAAIDHLNWDGVEQTMRETARVLRPGGQFLVVSLNPDHLVRIAIPASIHRHGYWGHSPDRDRWRDALTRAGFEVTRVGTRPAAVYYLARKLGP